ncbi:MAG: hypothetical protein ACREXR_10395 [Gammaproteobacteria bacterium]
MAEDVSTAISMTLTPVPVCAASQSSRQTHRAQSSRSLFQGPGALGFLRYNTHPARVFMGDTGSQFLGFTLGFLAVLLTQAQQSALSPAVALFVLGLPIIDILRYFLRIKNGMHWLGHIHPAARRDGLDIAIAIS